LGPLYPLCAQEVDAYIGLGTAWDSSNGNQIDTFGDQTLHAAPWLAGVFPHFGVNVLFNKQFGVGWTAAWRWASADYAGLQYHSTFHTFDAVFRPVKISTSGFVPEFRAGIGLTTVHFDFDNPSTCDQVPGCPTSRRFLGHVGVAVRLYVSDHIFLRPAVDVQYVKTFFLFGSNWVPRCSMSLGYSFGRE
jgi:hypothetical protein